MTFAVIDSSNWDKEDYMTFARDYNNYVLQVLRMNLTQKQRGYHRNIVRSLSEITIVLASSGPRLRKRQKQQLDALVCSCNLNAIGLFKEMMGQ